MCQILSLVVVRDKIPLLIPCNLMTSLGGNISLDEGEIVWRRGRDRYGNQAVSKLSFMDSGHPFLAIGQGIDRFRDQGGEEAADFEGKEKCMSHFLTMKEEYYKGVAKTAASEKLESRVVAPNMHVVSNKRVCSTVSALSQSYKESTCSDMLVNDIRNDIRHDPKRVQFESDV